MVLIMFTNWLASASAAGIGAFFGALGAYALACRKDDARRKAEYHCLLLLVYERLELLHIRLADFVEANVTELDGEKFVVFDTPLPDLEINSEQMQTLFEISPDCQMPSTLIRVQSFLTAHHQRMAKYGSDPLSLEFVQQRARQLQFMLLSVRTQYEQSANDAFPLD